MCKFVDITDQQQRHDDDHAEIWQSVGGMLSRRLHCVLDEKAISLCVGECIGAIR